MTRSRRPLVLLAAVLLTAVAAAILVVALGGDDAREEQAADRPPTGGGPALSAGGQRPFAASSPWNTAPPRGTSEDAQAPALLAALRRTEERGPRLAGRCGTQIVEVGRDARAVPVTLDGPQGRRAGRLGGPGVQALRAALAAGVPVPDGVASLPGCPGQAVVVWQRSTDTMWELRDLERRGGGLHARWGGKLTGASKSPGYFERRLGPGRRIEGAPVWGATGSGLAAAGGVVRPAELRRGRIDHALAVELPQLRARLFAFPAQRTNGTARGGGVPAGARLRLDPELDLARLRLSPAARTIARAAQTHGLIVRGESPGGPRVMLQSPGTGADPYPGLFGSGDYEAALERLPWTRVQVLPLETCPRAPCRAEPETPEDLGEVPERFVGDFESGDFTAWGPEQYVYEAEPDRVEIVDTPVREGRRAARFTVRSGDKIRNTNGERASVRTSIENTAGIDGQEAWYGWSVRFAPSAEPVRRRTTFVDFHETPAGADGCGVPLDFRLVPGQGDAPARMKMRVRGGPQLGVCRRTSDQDIDLGPVRYDRWYDFALRVRWSYEPGAGFVELYLDGRRRVPRTRTANLYEDRRVYMKFGFYRPDTQGAPDGELFFDAIRRGPAREDVEPD